MFKDIISSAALASIAVVWAAPAGAQDDAKDELLDRTPEDCIASNRIRDTEVLDDRTILFYMRGGKIYRNFLDQNCPGLARNKRFSTTTQTRRLCDIDTITVLEQYGSRFERGFTCRLGEFHPVTKEEAELMELEPNEAAAASRHVEVTPAGPVTETTGQEAEDAAETTEDD